MKYLLFVFAKHQNSQEKFVKFIAEDISVVSDSETVNFYFGPESIIYSFSSKEKLEDLKDYFDLLLGVMNIVYFMIPFEPDKMSYWISPEIEKTLLNTDKNTEKVFFDEENLLKVQKLFFGDTDSEESDFITKKIEPTLDELLDKIIDYGKDSLNDYEKELLNKYSKK
jgi:hypothetical protein